MAGALDTAFKAIAKQVVSDLGTALDTTITYSAISKGSYNVAAGKQLTTTTSYSDIKVPVEFILFFFGLMNAGVAFSAIGDATWLVLAGLFIGKPFGIFIFGWIAAKPLNFGKPEGMTYADIFVLGMVAGIGFTVSLFVASVAFDPGAVQDAAKMGALLSFAAAIISIILGVLFKIKKVP